MKISTSDGAANEFIAKCAQSGGQNHTPLINKMYAQLLHRIITYQIGVRNRLIVSCKNNCLFVEDDFTTFSVLGVNIRRGLPVGATLFFFPGFSMLQTKERCR
jgi:hypothetical protein